MVGNQGRRPQRLLRVQVPAMTRYAQRPTGLLLMAAGWAAVWTWLATLLPWPWWQSVAWIVASAVTAKGAQRCFEAAQTTIDMYRTTDAAMNHAAADLDRRLAETRRKFSGVPDASRP